MFQTAIVKIIVPAIYIFSWLISAPYQDATVIDSSTTIHKYDNPELFSSDEILNITLSGNVRSVLNDRGDNPQYHSLSFSYAEKDGNEISMPVNIKTRGHFRKSKENCNYPPLMLDFSKSNLPTTSLFYTQKKIKLVMPCNDDDYVIREWLVYKLYNLITPKSFKARLVKVTMDDASKKKIAPFYGILLEDEKQMAQRNKVMIVEKQSLKPQNTETDAFLTMAFFEYMIGNTDWSVRGNHNIKLMTSRNNISKAPYPVPYDFDYAGLVNADYAVPAENLSIKFVTERLYRGYPRNMNELQLNLEIFRHKKEAIMAYIKNFTLLNEKEKKEMTRYIDDFYRIINDKKSCQSIFIDNARTD